MAVDMYLKIDGVAGESTDSKHKSEIDVLSFSWGATQSASGAFGGGSGAGKVNILDLGITKRMDKSTPVLLAHCCTGKHFPHRHPVGQQGGRRKVGILENGDQGSLYNLLHHRRHSG